MSIKPMTFETDLKNKKINVVRYFKAPISLVWSAWTEPEHLEKWWAPKPYKAITKTLDFKEGGYWLYYMLGPEGNKHWCRADYETISKEDFYTAKDAFCDEHGSPNTEHPRMHWKNSFISHDNVTEVQVEINFQKAEDITKIIEMGFKEGFTMALENLDEVFAQ